MSFFDFLNIPPKRVENPSQNWKIHHDLKLEHKINLPTTKKL